MSFAWPHLLWLLFLPAGLLAWELTRRRRAAQATVRPKILRADIRHDRVELQREKARPVASRARPWLCVGLTFAILAIARPQWGRLEEPVFDQSREILIAVDLSRSMLSTDVKPSRLARAKLLIQALLEKLKGERVGLVVFSGTGFLQSPLSADYEILREFLPALKPDYLPEGGTNYRAMIDASLDAFGNGSAADRFLIVLSDGEATDEDWKPRAEELKEKGIRVLALGVGTPAGSMIPDDAGGFVKDDRGAVVLSKLESATLQQLAEITNGVYRDASAWIDLASLIEETVNIGRKGSFVDKTTVRLVERFQWPLALAAWCFLVSFYYEFPVRPRPREIALRGGKTARGAAGAAATPRSSASAGATAAALILCLAPLTLLSPRAQAAVKIGAPAQPSTPSPLTPIPSPTPAPAAPAPAAPTSEPSTLGKVVSRLSSKDTLSAPDLSELAHETLNWGRRVKEAGQQVPEGPVHDALAAVDQLQAKGDKLADWSELRRELETLLEKPPEQQKQPNQSDQPQDKNQDKQQNQQNQQDKSGQQKQNESKSDQQKSSSGQSKEDRQKEDRQKQSSPQDQQSAQNQSSAKNQGSRDNERKSEPKSSQMSAFGDMKKDAKPPTPQETQKVGGTAEKKPNAEKVDAALAVPVEKLEQLKDQDSPAELFLRMQSDQNNTPPPKKPGKTW